MVNKMAYSKRTLYVIKDDDNLKEEMLQVLFDLGTVSKSRARQIIFYATPMSLVRWSKYLTASQMRKYLVEYGTKNTTDVNAEDLGI